METNNSWICEHNSLRRSCPLCDANNEIEELKEEIGRLRAALKYIGNYDSSKRKYHEPNTVEFHLKEVAMENLECDVDYRYHDEK